MLRVTFAFFNVSLPHSLHVWGWACLYARVCVCVSQQWKRIFWRRLYRLLTILHHYVMNNWSYSFWEMDSHLWFWLWTWAKIKMHSAEEHTCNLLCALKKMETHCLYHQQLHFITPVSWCHISLTLDLGFIWPFLLTLAPSMHHAIA